MAFARSSRITLLFFILAVAALADPSSINVGYQKIMNFGVKYVAVNMNDPEVVITPAVAPGFPTHLESWGSFINRLQPDAAINGTYFCLRSNMPVGDVAVNSSLIYRGVVGTALCIGPDNRVVMRPGPRQAKPDWTGFRSVMCAGPRLLTNGKVTVNGRAEGFRDGHVLGSAPRSAVAWRPDGLLLFLTIEQSASLQNLAYICQHLGAVDAMALDGGNSSGLYARGRTLTRPERGLSNIIAIYATTPRYLQFASRLTPAGLPILADLSCTPPVAVADNAPVITSSQATVLPAPESTATDITAVPAPELTITAKPESVVRLLHTGAVEPVQGVVPLTIEVDRNAHLSWTSLRINGQLRAMGNIWPMLYQWDSTKESDGMHTLEVTAWSNDRTVVARDVRTLRVQNNRQVALK